MIIGVWKAKHNKSTGTSLFKLDARGKSHGWNITHPRITKGDGLDKYVKECKVGDTVEMILDIDQSQIRYTLNSKPQGIAFQDIEEGGYVIGVTLSGCIIGASCDEYIIAANCLMILVGL